MAEDLAAGPALPVIVSPLRRTRETCEPLADRWAVNPTVDAAVGEIPSPDEDLAGRSAWLRRVLAGRWEDLDETRRRWRDEVLAHLCGLDASAVVVTHFVVINVAIGAALGRDEVVCARPDHCSRTVVEVGAGPGTLARSVLAEQLASGDPDLVADAERRLTELRTQIIAAEHSARLARDAYEAAQRALEDD